MNPREVLHHHVTGAIERGEAEPIAEITPEIIEAQRMVNSGMAWRMEGAYGRATMAALERGDLMLGPKGLRDYYGNYVPARSEVQEGTKGSRGRVAEIHGEAYARALEAVE